MAKRSYGGNYRSRSISARPRQRKPPKPIPPAPDEATVRINSSAPGAGLKLKKYLDLMVEDLVDQVEKSGGLRTMSVQFEIREFKGSEEKWVTRVPIKIDVRNTSGLKLSKAKRTIASAKKYVI